MENCYAVRVSYPYVSPGMDSPSTDGEGVIGILRTSVRSIVNMWSTHVQRMVVYEHDDDGANRIHCHLMLEGVRISKKRLQQLASEVCNVTVQSTVRGQRASSLMSFRSKDYDGNIAGFSYCTKGKYDPKYIQGWTAEDAQRWKEAWVAPELHTKRTPWKILREEFDIWWNDKPNRLDLDITVTTDLIRTRVFKFLWAKHGGDYPPQAKTQRWYLITNYCHCYQVPFPVATRGEWRM